MENMKIKNYNHNLDDCHCCNGTGKRLSWGSQMYYTCPKCNGLGKFDYGD